MTWLSHHLRFVVCCVYGLGFATIILSDPEWLGFTQLLVLLTLSSYLAVWYWEGERKREGGLGPIWKWYARSAVLAAVLLTLMLLIALVV